MTRSHLALLCLLAACAGSGPPPAPDAADGGVSGQEPDGGAVPLRQFGPWQHSQIAEPRRGTIRDAAAWAGFWAQLGEVGEPKAVDFGQEMVLVAALGGRPTGGFRIEIRSAVERDGRLEVEVVETFPGTNCGVTTAVTSPVAAAAVPARPEADIRWVERREAHDCR